MNSLRHSLGTFAVAFVFVGACGGRTTLDDPGNDAQGGTGNVGQGGSGNTAQGGTTPGFGGSPGFGGAPGFGGDGGFAGEPGFGGDGGFAGEPGFGGDGGFGGDPGFGGSGGFGGGTGGWCGFPVDRCEDCHCFYCEDQVYACRNNEGCSAIRDCERANNCSGPMCVFGVCFGVVNQWGGPGSEAARLALSLDGCANGQCRDQCNGPTGVGGGPGQGGGPGFGGGPGQGGGPGFGGGPGQGGTGGAGGAVGECLDCLASDCPAGQQCFSNPACVSGSICTLQNCINGGGPNIPCAIGCFNGDIQTAQQAFPLVQCAGNQCAGSCTGVLGGPPPPDVDPSPDPGN